MKEIQKQWLQIVLSNAPVVQLRDRYLLIGDGIKIAKEAQKMPGVKKLHQESNNSGKPEYIQGHHHGVIGILAGRVKKNSFVFPFVRSCMKGLRSLEVSRINRCLLLTAR